MQNWLLQSLATSLSGQLMNLFTDKEEAEEARNDKSFWECI